MGGSNSTGHSSQNYEEVLQQYRQLDTFYNMQLGDGTLLVHKEDPHKYAISRKFVTNNEDQFLSYLDMISSRENMRHKHICHTLAYGEEKDSGFCSTQYFVKMIVEHSNYPILTEIEKRQSEGSGFSEKEIYLLICESLSALNYYSSFNIQHQNIRPDTILLCKQNNNPNELFHQNEEEQQQQQYLQGDVYVKVQDPVIFTPQTNYNLAYINLPSAHTFNYLSPILTYSIQKSDPNPMHNTQKSDLFTLGMVMLHVALLEDNNDCYDFSNRRFMEDTLMNKLHKLRQFYSQELVEIIEAMLQIDEENRPDPNIFYNEIRKQDSYFASRGECVYVISNNNQRSSPKQHIDIHQEEEHHHHHHEQEEEHEHVKRAGHHHHEVENHHVNETPVMAKEYEDSGSKNNFQPSSYEQRPQPDQYGDHLIKQVHVGESYRQEPVQHTHIVETAKHHHHVEPEQHHHTKYETTKTNEVIPLNDPRNPYYSEYIRVQGQSVKNPMTGSIRTTQTKLYKQTSQAEEPANYEEKLKRSTYKHLHEADDTPKVYLNEQVKFGMTGSNVIKFDDPRNPFYKEYLAGQERKSQYQRESQHVEHTKHSAAPHHNVRQSHMPVSYTHVEESHFGAQKGKESFQAYNMHETQNVANSKDYRAQLLSETQNRPQNGQMRTSNIGTTSSNVYDFVKQSSGDQNQIIEQYEDGSKYEGEKLQGQRNGYGKFFYPMGGRYEGFWLNDKMDGKGRLYGPNGSLSYDGEFKQDQFDGIGTLYNEDLVENGFASQPNFKDLNVERSWSRFEGNFKNDEKNGWGTLYFQNGSRFEGQFVNDKANGFGTYFYTGQSQDDVRGRWENNVFVSEF